MSSVIDICNLALSNIGKENIQAMTDAGAEAKACRQFYDHSRDLLLQAYPWRFAGKTVSLAEVVNDRPGQWGYAYDRPIDALKVRWLRPAYTEDGIAMTLQVAATIPYSIDGNTIYTGISPAILHYTSRFEDASKFPPLFVDALAWHLAVRLAMPLTRDPKIRADAWQVATSMTATAQANDANETRSTSDHESEMIDARSGVISGVMSGATTIRMGSGDGSTSGSDWDAGNPLYDVS